MKNLKKKNIPVRVAAKYVYGKPVNGNARLEVFVRGQEQLRILTTTRQTLMPTDNQDSVTSFNISLAKIMASDVIANQFPDGKRLEIIATVYEAETGNEENSKHGSTLFTRQPYKFVFTQSKSNYRPGMEYFLKFQLLYANGEPVPNEALEVDMFDKDAHIITSRETTDSEGIIMEAFPTHLHSNQIRFKVRMRDFQWESDDFVVLPYVGKNQIQVEMVKTSDGKNWMRAYTNAQGDKYTGMLFMVVSRGNVVFTKYQPSGNQVSNELNDILEKAISPSGRLIVFYVDTNTNEVVADSVKFKVRPLCRGNPLTLNAGRLWIKPGSTSTLILEGDAFMNVGLNIMDKALLLLNNKNILKKETMFDTLDSHDLGCGEGSGSNSAEVFKSTGLTVLTNANIQKNLLQRQTFDCEEKIRKKRQAYDDCYGANSVCCEKGAEYADDVMYRSSEKVDAFHVCYAQAKLVFQKGKVPMICISAYFRSCVHIIKSYYPAVLSGRSLDPETDYITDLEQLIAYGGEIRTRNDFRESWQFKVMDLDKNGHTKMRLVYPDSITEWMIQAIGISDEGLCVAEPANVTAFRDFFVQMDMPYAAKRLEHLDVKATVFNYAATDKRVSVYLRDQDGLCYDRGSGKESKRISLELLANSAQTVIFPMVPLKSGKLPVTVTAMIPDRGSPESDSVKKYLNVENEGVEEKVPIEVCLDPRGQAKDCKNHGRVVSQSIKNVGANSVQEITVNVTLPSYAIPQTGTATGYLQGTVMDNVVQTLLENGVESLFREPAGCGEQTMIRLAPTVSAMKYLRDTKQVTDEIEEKGYRFIRAGVDREVDNYRHADGSYAAWRHRTSSTWLTAFVAKVFCQAMQIVDDAVDEKDDLEITIKWLVDNIRPDGSFVERERVIHREMVGQVRENEDASLTAYVLVALQECSVRIKGLNHTIEKARKNLERLDRNMLSANPYILALSTYALALSNSNKSGEFKQLLENNIEHKSVIEGTHWGHAGGFPASANSVETTAYALLAMLQFGDMKTSGEIVKWLTSQRNSAGAFRSTQDTVVGLQALSEYSVSMYSNVLDLKITLLAKGWDWKKQLPLTRENAILQKVIKKLPVERGDNKLIIKVEGVGSGRMMIDLRYHRPAKKNEVCGFNVSEINVDDVTNLDINIQNLGDCDVCGKCANDMPPDFYDDVAFGNDNVEVAPRIVSNIGRKRRAVGNRAKRISASLKCVKFSVSAAYNDSGMTVVIFGMETGVEALRKDLDKLVDEEPNIDYYEYDDTSFVVFYLRSATSEKTNFIFRVRDTFNDMGGQLSRQPASVTIYDYYNPDKTCTKLYRTVGEAFSYKCDNSRKPQCACVQRVCVRPIDKQLMRLAKAREAPAAKLLLHTCNAEKANYAVIVKITGLTYDETAQQKRMSAQVIKSLHKGIQALEKEDEMIFYYPQSCQKPGLKIGDKAYIIGPDGGEIITGLGQPEFQYPLMGTAKVVKISRNMPHLLAGIMKSYENRLKNGCNM